jgi:ketosteroid isomerase-like protein
MNTHTYARKANLLALLTLLVVFLIGGLAACGGVANALPSTTQTNAQPNTKPAESSATTVVTTYLQLFNAGMRSGDFSAMASVFAPDATLTQSNPKGVTTVVHGLAAITSFYQGLKTKFAGYQWTVESMRSLAPNVVLVYQHAGSPPLRVAGRCVHVFVVQNGKITSYDWATYYPGQQ